MTRSSTPSRSREPSEPTGAAAVPRGYPVTPDGRYFVVRGRLWRRSNPALPEARREELVKALMAARRAVRSAKRAAADGSKSGALAEARAQVDAAKIALGERGAAWWDDGTPDENRRLAARSSYAAWFAALKDAPDTPSATSAPE